MKRVIILLACFAAAFSCSKNAATPEDGNIITILCEPTTDSETKTVLNNGESGFYWTFSQDDEIFGHIEKNNAGQNIRESISFTIKTYSPTDPTFQATILDAQGRLDDQTQVRLFYPRSCMKDSKLYSQSGSQIIMVMPTEQTGLLSDVSKSYFFHAKARMSKNGNLYSCAPKLHGITPIVKFNISEEQTNVKSIKVELLDPEDALLPIAGNSQIKLSSNSYDIPGSTSGATPTENAIVISRDGEDIVGNVYVTMIATTKGSGSATSITEDCHIDAASIRLTLDNGSGKTVVKTKQLTSKLYPSVVKDLGTLPVVSMQ